MTNGFYWVRYEDCEPEVAEWIGWLGWQRCGSSDIAMIDADECDEDPEPTILSERLEPPSV